MTDPTLFARTPGIDDPNLDEAKYLALVERLRNAKADEVTVPAGIEPLRPQDLHKVPEPGTPLYAECLKLGEEALRKGEIAAAVVAGGAGTRFGGAVKGLVPILGQRTFLELKLDDAHLRGVRYGKPVPVVLMTSSATHEGMAALRIQPIAMALGQAAGTAAALSLREGTRPRELEITLLQRTLIEQGANLGASALAAAR
jgi:hypothetical protein